MSFKWIITISLFIIYSQSQAWKLDNKLRPIDPKDVIIDFEKYNKDFFNQTSNIPKEELKLIKDETTRSKPAIESASFILQKRMKVSKQKADRIGTLVIFASKKYKIDPRLMLSIIKVESDFSQLAHNSYSCKYKRETDKKKCGDHSVAQINYHIWKSEFIKLGRKPLDYNRLKSDDAYAVFRMAEILNILKNNYSKKEASWYARYHSSDIKLKKTYQVKVDKEFLKIKDINPEQLFHEISSI